MSIWIRTVVIEQMPAMWGAGVVWSSGEYGPGLSKHHPDWPTLESGVSRESDGKAVLVGLE